MLLLIILARFLGSIEFVYDAFCDDFLLFYIELLPMVFIFSRAFIFS